MNKTYACSDLHGMYGFWKKIKDMMDETDTLYFLGDAIDRGPRGIDIVREMLADPRVIYLIGNHEEMMIDSLKRMQSGQSISKQWAINDSEYTVKFLHQIGKIHQAELLSALESDLVREATYINKAGQTIHMTHAGTTPEWDEPRWAANRIYSAYTWNRNHFFDEWPAGYEDRFEVHGHTPTIFLEHDFNTGVNSHSKHFQPSIFRYANGHKIDIDLGCFAFDRTALLDLDTLEPIYISV